MGLDLYCGTLTRYHTGRWDSVVVSMGKNAGMVVNTIYQNRPKRLSRLTAAIQVRGWRRRLSRKYAHLVPQGFHWTENAATEYWTAKPDHDGLRALVLAAAYGEHPQFAQPSDLPNIVEADLAYAEASKDYLQSAIAVLECHMFIPSSENILLADQDAVGTRRFITSTANLGWALDKVNHAHWNADPSTIDAWSRRGALTGKVIHVEDGHIVREVEVAPSPDPFEHCAQFGFAIYNEALNFSRKHNLPILTDE